MGSLDLFDTTPKWGAVTIKQLVGPLKTRVHIVLFFYSKSASKLKSHKKVDIVCSSSTGVGWGGPMGTTEKHSQIWTIYDKSIEVEYKYTFKCKSRQSTSK